METGKAKSLNSENSSLSFDGIVSVLLDATLPLPPAQTLGTCLLYQIL